MTNGSGTIPVFYSLPRLVTTPVSFIFTVFLCDLYVNTFRWDPGGFFTLDSIYTSALIVFYIAIGLLVNLAIKNDNGNKFNNSKIIAMIGLSVYAITFLLIVLLPLIWSHGSANSLYNGFDPQPFVIKSNLTKLESKDILEIDNSEPPPDYESIFGVTRPKRTIIYLIAAVHAIGCASFDVSSRALSTYIYPKKEQKSEINNINSMNLDFFGGAGLITLLVVSAAKHRLRFTVKYAEFFNVYAVLLILSLIPIFYCFYMNINEDTSKSPDNSSADPPSIYDYCKLASAVIHNTSLNFWFLTLASLIQYISTFVLDGNTRFKASGQIVVLIGFAISTSPITLWNLANGNSGDSSNNLLDKIMICGSIGCQTCVYLLFFRHDWSWNKDNWFNYLILLICGIAYGILLLNINISLDNVVKKDCFKNWKYLTIGGFFSVSNLFAFLASCLLHKFYGEERLVDHTCSCIRPSSICNFINVYTVLTFTFQFSNIIGAAVYLFDKSEFDTYAKKAFGTDGSLQAQNCTETEPNKPQAISAGKIETERPSPPKVENNPAHQKPVKQAGVPEPSRPARPSQPPVSAKPTRLLMPLQQHAPPPKPKPDPVSAKPIPIINQRPEPPATAKPIASVKPAKQSPQAKSPSLPQHKAVEEKRQDRPVAISPQQKLTNFIKEQISKHNLKNFIKFYGDAIKTATPLNSWNTHKGLASAFYQNLTTSNLNGDNFKKATLELAKQAKSDFQKYAKKFESKDENMLEDFSNGLKKLLLLSTTDIQSIKGDFADLQEHYNILIDALISMSNKSMEEIDGRLVNGLDSRLNSGYTSNSKLNAKLKDIMDEEFDQDAIDICHELLAQVFGAPLTGQPIPKINHTAFIIKQRSLYAILRQVIKKHPLNYFIEFNKKLPQAKDGTTFMRAWRNGNGLELDLYEYKWRLQFDFNDFKARAIELAVNVFSIFKEYSELANSKSGRAPEVLLKGIKMILLLNDSQIHELSRHYSLTQPPEYYNPVYNAIREDYTSKVENHLREGITKESSDKSFNDTAQNMFKYCKEKLNNLFQSIDKNIKAN